MKVYVVLEEDRGCGPSIAGVFATLSDAKAYLAGPDASGCYLYDEDGELVQAQEENRLLTNFSLVKETTTRSSPRHGDPYDRGSADSYYRRKRKPHYYEGGTGMSPLVEEKDMTAAEIAEYNKGYDDNEAAGNYKDFGR